MQGSPSSGNAPEAVLTGNSARVPLAEELAAARRKRMSHKVRHWDGEREPELPSEAKIALALGDPERLEDAVEAFRDDGLTQA